MSKVQNVEQAISVLIQAAKIGQAKGAYSLEDAAMIADAIAALAPQQPQAEAVVEEGDASAPSTEG